MRFRTEVEDITIIKATNIIRLLGKDSEFLDRVSAIKKFNYTQDRGEDVVLAIIESDIVIPIRSYKTFNPFSSVIGYASNGVIYVNTRKLHLPLRDRVENLFHESMHILGYSHNGNKNNAYNRGTVPYLVATIFSDYCREKGYV